MPLQRKLAKPNVLLKVAGGNLAAECCCQENYLYTPCAGPTPTPTTMKTCQFTWVAIYDCDLEIFTTLYSTGSTCIDVCIPTDWVYTEQVGNTCWYQKVTCEFVCTNDGDCEGFTPTPPGLPFGPFSCACAPS
jgi:hypothetical protein